MLIIVTPTKDDFKSWLSDEGFIVKEINIDDSEDFHLVVENIGNSGFSFEVGKPKNKQFIRLITSARFSPETTQQLKNLGTATSKFLTGIQRELLKFNIDHEFRPNKESLEHLILYKNLYPDNMTQANFMNTFSNLKNAMFFFIWGVAQKVDPESDPAQFKTTGKQSPYT